MDFCEKTGLSLPTEAQWEYACRAGTNTLFAFGNTRPSKAQVNYDNYMTVEVEAVPNDFGLHNTHGNVSEWCADFYDPNRYEKLQEGATDPISSSRPAGSNDLRVIRGGTWNYGWFYCYSALRRYGPPDDYGGAEIGFRPVYSLK